MEHCDREIPATKRPKHSDGGGGVEEREIPAAKRPKLSDGGGGGSEDRLSALPDDVLIQILQKLLDAAAAGRTSVLSTRWRRLWALLPVLQFRVDGDPQRQRVRLALAAHEAPVLRRLAFEVLHADPDPDPESLTAWLPIAARRLSGSLLLSIAAPEDKAAEGGGGGLDLPCFKNATSMYLWLGYLGLAVPPSGVFARLASIILSSVDLRGSSMLGDAVSSPRCPTLRSLTVQLARGVGNLSIHSNSLLEIKLMHLRPPELGNDNLGLGSFAFHSESLELLTLTFLRGMQQLDVMAPALTILNVDTCFALSRNQPVANISAPRLKSLRWNDAYHPSSTHFGNMENLKWLSTFAFHVYGYPAHSSNTYRAGLLRRIELVRTLSFELLYMPNMTDRQYVMGDITKLPDITCLSLTIVPEVHSFGASLFHVLRMATGLRKLKLTLGGATSHQKVQPVCPSGCVCEHPSNWKTEELALNRLKGVEIHKLRGTEHEAALIKRLFEWAVGLAKMTVTFDCSVTESKAKEFFQMLRSFSRPEICVQWPR